MNTLLIVGSFRSTPTRRLDNVVPMMLAVKLSGCPAEINNFQIQVRAEQVAILLLQSGTGENNIFPVAIPAQQFIVNGIEPRCAIRIAERNAPMHLLPVYARVKIVRVQKNPTQAPRQQFPDGSLPGAGDTHDENDHKKGLWH